MSEVRIERITDSHDCETCGWSYAEGAHIYLDGILVRSCEPSAHCTSPTHWDEEALMGEILSVLGHTLAAHPKDKEE